MGRAGVVGRRRRGDALRVLALAQADSSWSKPRLSSVCIRSEAKAWCVFLSCIPRPDPAYSQKFGGRGRGLLTQGSVQSFCSCLACEECA